MQKKVGSLLTCMLLHACGVLAQCPQQSLLWKRMNEIRESPSVPLERKLEEVQGYLSGIKQCAYRNDSTHTALLSLLAGLYGQQGNFTKAVAFRQEAIAIISANADRPSTKLKTLPGIYYWLSIAYDSLGNYAEKMKALDSCSVIAMRIGHVDRAVLMSIYTRLQYFFDVGDYHRCIDYALGCQSLARQYQLSSNAALERQAGESYISSAFGWQIMALIKLKDFAQAEGLLVHKAAEYKNKKQFNYLGSTLSQLAELQLNKGAYRKALEFYMESLRWDTRAGYIFNRRQTLKDIGFVMQTYENDEKKAMQFYRQALRTQNRDKNFTTADAFESLDIYGKMAMLYMKRRLYDSAYHYFQLALSQVKEGADEIAIARSSPDELIQFKKIYYLTRLLINKGMTLVDQYKNSAKTEKLVEAITIFKSTDHLLDRIRREQSDAESKLFWRRDIRLLYENAIEACFLKKDAAAAFYFFEKSRAVLLSDQLNEQRWLGQAIIRQQNGLKKKISQLEKEAIELNRTTDKYASLQTKLFASKQDLDRIQQGIKTTYPLYYQNFVASNPSPVADVQKKLLSDHSALIEIFEGDSAVYLLYLSAPSLLLKKIEKTAFDTLAVSFTEWLSQPARLNKSFPHFVETAQKLYQLLFQNISIRKGRIIVSPDKTNFPFEALVTGTRPLAYFVKDFAVSYTYSARYLLNEFTPSGGAFPFLGVAPVQFAGRFHLPALPGSDVSLERLKGHFAKSDILVSEKAVRNQFLKQFFRYKIVQLYTHATDNGLNAEPTIYFRDSVLLLSDLMYENQPATRLVMLSACETGTGKVYQGEGIFSFNRGFAAIGIPSSITSLWQVDNESTYRLTELFYKWLSKKLPIDLALQSAKLEFLQTTSKEKSLPYYWAAPVLAGKTDVITMEKAFPWGWVAAAGGFALLAGWVYRRKRNSSKPGALKPKPASR